MTPREIAENCFFWKDVREHRLLTDDQLERCLESIPDNKREPEKIDNRLARVSIHHGYLTLWQAQRILTRRADTLRIDKYLLTDPLGQGGMGRVFLAKDTRLQRMVALKVLNPDKLNHERSLARFQREALVGGQLQHENLVRVYDVGVHHNAPYLVMEYIEGPTVAELIERQGRLEIPVSARIARDVALGLHHLAEKKLVHRDVNPRNILIDKEGRAKLTDLGLAIFEEQLSQVTNEGSTVGTFDYISPEQARHSHKVDIRSDIYSLGCSIYHMLSGHPPFPEGNLAEKIYAHQLREAEPLAELVPGVSREVSELVRKCLRKTPEERFPNARELADRLSRFVTEESLVTTIELNRSATAEIAAQSATAKPDSDDRRRPSESGQDVSPEEAGPAANDQAGTLRQDESIQLDLGIDSLELPYRGESPRPRSFDSAEPSLPAARRRRTLVLAVGTILVVGLLAVSSLFIPRPRPEMPEETQGGSEPSKQGGQVATEKKAIPPDRIALAFPNGRTQAYESLGEAVRNAIGQTAEIRIPHRDRPWIWEMSDSRLIADTRLKIVGTGETRPRVVFDLSNSKSGLIVRADSVLELTNLRLEPKEAKPDSPMMSAYGEVILSDTEWFAASGQKLPKSAIFAGTRKLSIRSCWFSGFPVAIDAQIHPETRIDLVGSVFSAGGTLSGGGKTNGRASELVLRLGYPAWKVDKAVVTIDRCLLYATDLIGLAGPNPAPGMSIVSKRSIFVGDRLFVFEPGFAGISQRPKWVGTSDVFASGIKYWPASKGAAGRDTLDGWRDLVSETGSTIRTPNRSIRMKEISTPAELLTALGFADYQEFLSINESP